MSSTCTCVSINRDPLCAYHGDVDKVMPNVAADRDKLRAALAGLVGVDGKAELEEMEAAMRLTLGPSQDKAVIIDAIHALLATL